MNALMSKREAMLRWLETREQGPDYLTFTALEPNSTVALNKTGDPTLLTARLEYRMGKTGAWQKYTWNGNNGLVLPLDKVGDRCQFRAEDVNETFTRFNASYIFTGTPNAFAVSGDLMSLLDRSISRKDIPEYAFRYLFRASLYFGITSIVADAGDLSVSATTISTNGLYSLLYKAHTKRPIRLADRLEYAVSDSLGDIYDSSSVEYVKVPFIEWYGGFALHWHLYGCKNLKEIDFSINEWGAHHQTEGWVQGVPAGGVFHCPAELPVEFGDSRIPYGWTVDNGLTEPTEEEILNACYTYDSSNGRLAIQPDFKECLNREVQIDFVKHGKKYWAAGTPLPNPHRPELSEHYSVTSLLNLMFSGPWYDIRIADLSAWDLSKTNSFDNAFNSTIRISEIRFPSSAIIKPTSFGNVFTDDYDLVSIDLSVFDFSQCSYFSYYCFRRCNSVTEAWARTQADADKLNAEVERVNLPWRFQIHPDLVNVQSFTLSNAGVFNGRYDLNPTEKTPEGYPIYNNAEVYNYRLEVRKVGEQFFYAFQNIVGGKTYTCKTALDNPVPAEACTGKRYLTRDLTYTDGQNDYTVQITFP